MIVHKNKLLQFKKLSANVVDGNSVDVNGIPLMYSKLGPIKKISLYDRGF